MKVKRVKMWRINRLPNITQQTMGRWHILHSDVFSAIWKPTEKIEKTEKIENGGGEDSNIRMPNKKETPPVK